MTDEITTDDGTIWIQWDPHVVVECEHCDRTERLKDEMTAYAWIVGHIQAEHADELPDYEGTGTEQS